MGKLCVYLCVCKHIVFCLKVIFISLIFLVSYNQTLLVYSVLIIYHTTEGSVCFLTYYELTSFFFFLFSLVFLFCWLILDSPESPGINFPFSCFHLSMTVSFPMSIFNIYFPYLLSHITTQSSLENNFVKLLTS